MKTIVELLESVSKKEKLNIEQDALYAIGKAAQGSLRDALSILDQLSALSDGGGIASEDVVSMLGLVETELLFELTDAVGQKNCVLGLEVLEKVIDKGKDIKQLSRDIIEHFRHLMVIKAGGKALGRLVDYPAAVKDMLLSQCQKFTLKEILAAIDTFVEAQETARITESARMPLEVALAKLTYRGEDALPVDKAPAQPADRGPVPAAKKTDVFSSTYVPRENKGDADVSGSREVPEAKAEEVSTTREDMVKDTGVLVDENTAGVEEGQAIIFELHRVRHAWDALTHAVSREKMSVATYLQEGVPFEINGKTLTVGFPAHCRFQKEALEDSRNIQLVERIFSEKFKTGVTIKYKIVEDCEPRSESQDVKDVLETFQGKVVSRWHDES
jgi:DNA polymerase-3 subunit gamma/tau